MRRWLRLGLQIISLALFGIVFLWGGPEAWAQVANGDRSYILISFMLLGIAGMVAALRLKIIACSVTGKNLASWSRFYYLNMTIRAIGLVMPRSLSILGGKSVALSTLGISLRRSIWIILLNNAFDVLLLGVQNIFQRKPNSS